MQGNPWDIVIKDAVRQAKPTPQRRSKAMKNFNRNLQTLESKTGQEVKSQIETILANAEKFKGCYFWNNTGNAAARRAQEFIHEFYFFMSGKKYEVSQELIISCKNFYFKTTVLVDGEKKTVAAIKKLV